MGKRPGIMVYFDMLDALDEYEDDERGKLFSAMLRYGMYGELPEFEDRGMRTLWKNVQPRIDADGVRYEQSCRNKSYSVYVREAKKRGEEPLSREAWGEQQDETSNDINFIQQQPQQQPQHQFQPQNTNINNNPSTNNQQPMYNNQSAAHNGKGLVCTAEEMEQMYNEAMTRFARK